MAYKDTKGKLRLNLVPIKALKEVARVREHGCIKYEDEEGNGYLTHVPPEKFAEAARRHILEYLEGNMYDHESGLLHLGHAAASIMMAIEIIETEKEND